MITNVSPQLLLGTVNYYDAHAREYCESTWHLDLHEVHERFLKELASGAHILDAGCGSGRDTKAFLSRGYQVTAIEASSSWHDSHRCSRTIHPRFFFSRIWNFTRSLTAFGPVRRFSTFQKPK